VWHNNNNLSLAYRWGLIATAITCVVVVLGAFTRLADAGLGCPDWPGCYGHLTWPTDAASVAVAEARFPESPVEHDKTWPEMVHRYFAGTLGLIILGLALATWHWAAKAPHQSFPRFHSLGILLLVIVQAAFGMWTVTLKLWPQVVTAHLLGGFATLSLLWLYTQRVSGAQWQLPHYLHQKLFGLKFLSVLALIAVIIQIALGGWTSSNYAALACTDLPTCHGEWWPAMDFVHAFNFAQDIGPNYLGGLLENEARTAIHMTHRMGAILVSLLVLILWWRLLAFGSVVTRPIAWLLLLVLLVQIALGVSNVLGSLPLVVAVAHNGVGALLLLVMITLNHRVFTAKSC
jgi:cytochrome c oxidase assembly protein subunit 15